MRHGCPRLRTCSPGVAPDIWHSRTCGGRTDRAGLHVHREVGSGLAGPFSLLAGRGDPLPRTTNAVVDPLLEVSGEDARDPCPDAVERPSDPASAGLVVQRVRVEGSSHGSSFQPERSEDLCLT
jgi:hypothetical protein